jgi:hypothetical protein
MPRQASGDVLVSDENRKDWRKLKVPRVRGKQRPEFPAQQRETFANGGIDLAGKGVGAEPLNSAPGAEEG